MECWLRSNNIPFDPKTRTKITLYKTYIAQERKRSIYHRYYIDELAKTKGIEIIRLPPYHCQFNPIELIWATLKPRAGKRNANFKMAELREIFEEEVQKITADEWKNCIKHAQKLVEEYLTKECLFFKEVDPLVIEFQEEEEDEEDDVFFVAQCDADVQDETVFETLKQNLDSVISSEEASYLENLFKKRDW